MHELHPRVAEVVDLLKDSQLVMEAQLALMDDAKKNAPALDGRWSVAQHVEHLAIVEDGSGRLMSKLIKQIQVTGAVETDDTSVLDSLDRYQVWNVGRRVEAPEWVRPRDGLTADEALARLATARERMIEALTKASGLALESATFPHPLVGPLNVYQWGIITAHHQQRHGTLINAITGPNA